MGRINWGRVFVGGLVGGLIINLFECLTNGVVLAANWDAAMKGSRPPLSRQCYTCLHCRRLHHRGRGNLAICSCSPTFRRWPQDCSINRLRLLGNGIRAAHSRPDSSGIVPEAPVGHRKYRRLGRDRCGQHCRCLVIQRMIAEVSRGRTVYQSTRDRSRRVQLLPDVIARPTR